MSDPIPPRWERLDLMLLLFAPLTQLLLLSASWMWGAVWIGGFVWVLIRIGMVMVQLLGVVATVVLLLWQRASTFPPTPQRNFSTTFLFFGVALAILLPWAGVFDWLRTQGRHYHESTIPLEALADDCYALVKQHQGQLAETGQLVEIEEEYPSTIARLGNVKVWLTGDGLRIDRDSRWFGDGYSFVQEKENGDWLLIWVKDDQTETLWRRPRTPRQIGED
jgi:hypothetical protein